MSPHSTNISTLFPKYFTEINYNNGNENNVNNKSVENFEIHLNNLNRIRKNLKFKKTSNFALRIFDIEKWCFRLRLY